MDNLSRLFRLGKQYRVIIQLPDGETYNLFGVLTSTEFTGFSDGPTHVSVDFSGDRFIKTTAEDMSNAVRVARQSSEWFCDYCNQTNLREHIHCQHCGGRRSFLYG
jgi:hypothetical protein